MHYVYIVECQDKTYYTGYTCDIEKRIKAHNEGKGAKYTRARLPVQLIYKEQFEDKREAMRREYAIKQLTRKQKIQLIKEGVCDDGTTNG
ncbi:MAG: GIY-YIG nuclease family protein [Cellulosilyticaceae bacterium]